MNPSPDRTPTPAAAPARILVVDDDQAVRDAIARTLRREGHEVVCAESGEAALALTAPVDAAHAFDLVISDVVMPGISGVDLVERLRRANPSLELILISGYPGKHLDNPPVVLSNGDLLQKPFTPRQLAARVQQKIERVAARHHLDAAST
ncbi:MAG TPA: response regulator [Gemmatimonadaceae bacterium]|nr:response regulator [Gemmatimonadaceae bacterium]